MKRSADNVPVAKHFLSDRESFKATAKHWAQAYAQAPANKAKRAEGKQMTDAEMAGLAEANVVQFAEMGFPRDKVVSRLGWCCGGESVIRVILMRCRSRY